MDRDTRALYLELYGPDTVPLAEAPAPVVWPQLVWTDGLPETVALVAQTWRDGPLQLLVNSPQWRRLRPAERREEIARILSGHCYAEGRPELWPRFWQQLQAIPAAWWDGLIRLTV